MRSDLFKAHYADIKNQFKELAQNGANGYEIAEKLDIDARQAKALHFDLLKKGEIAHTVELEFVNLGEPEVADKGNIFITAHRLAALGLKDIFSPTARLKIKRNGDDLVISVATGGKRAGVSGGSQSAGMEKRSLMRRIFGSKSAQLTPTEEN